MSTLTNIPINARSMNGITVVSADEIYGENINASGSITINGNSLSNTYVDLTSNQVIQAQKTFYLNYEDISLNNPYMRAFTGFTAPGPGVRVTMLGTVGAYNTTISNWTFVSGASTTRTNFVQWWYGSSFPFPLEWAQNKCVGSPPPLLSTTFTGNYGLAFTTNAPTQSFYTQTDCNLSAGAYILTFYSYWGSSPYGGGYIGSTTASVTVSLNNVSDVYKYADPETRSNTTWKKHDFFFTVSGTNATYIRWTPNETQSAVYTFRWAIAGLSVRKYSGQIFDDAGTGTTTIGGSLSYIQNPYLLNPIALQTLTCKGIPSFATTNGANNLVLNATFNTSEDNINNLVIGNGLKTGSKYTDNTIIGSYSGGYATTLRQSTNIGYLNTSYYRDFLGGTYLRVNQLKDPSGNDIGEGLCVVIGAYIGVANTETKDNTTGCSTKCVAIGSEQYTRYNGFGKNPFSPLESVSIGHRSQYLNWDDYNTSVGCYSLGNIDGNNNNDDGFGYPHITQYNVAIGHSAGKTPRNASYSTFIGSFADMSGNLAETTQCHYSTALGYNTKVRGNYATAIGSGVYNDVSNSVRIGRSSDTCFIDGNLNIHSGKINYVNSTSTLNVNCYSVFNFEVTLVDTLRCNSILLYPNEISQLTGIDTNQTIQSQLNSKANDTNVVHNSGDESINGIKTFNNVILFSNGLTLSGGVLTLPSASIADSNLSSNVPLKNGDNIFTALNTFSSGLTLSGGVLTLPSASIADSALSSNIPLINGTNIFTSNNTFEGIRIGSTPYGYSEGIVFPNVDGYRKLVLYPVNDNPYENYSIGAHHTSNEMNFTVPDSAKSFNFGYATSSTARSNILTLNSSSLTLSPNAYLKIGSAGYTPPTNSLSMGQNSSYRKIILHSVIDNEFQNYSIGTNTTNNEMVFMIPGITRTFKFCNATSGTAKNDLFILGKDSGASLSVALTLSAGLTASATQTINFGTNAPTMAGTNISGVAKTASANTFSSLNTFSAGLTVSSGDLTSPNLKTSGALDILSTGTGNVSLTATNGDVRLMGFGTNKGVRFLTNGTYTNVFFDNPPSYVGGTGLTFDANYQVFKNTSIRASKEYINEIPDNDSIFNLDTFMRLKPSLFYPKQGYGNTKKRCIGFIAEEIKELGLKELNTFEDEDLTILSGVHYEYFSAYLVKAVQLQQKIINRQQQKIETLENKIDDLISILKSKNII